MNSKKIILISTVIILILFIIKCLMPKTLEFSYIPQNGLMKCEAENYQMGMSQYKGQLSNYPLKHWEVKMIKMDNKKTLNTHLLANHEDPISEGTSVMMATNCEILSSAESYIKDYQATLAQYPDDETIKNEYDVYYYDKSNNQVELKRARIINSNIYINIKDYITNEQLPESKEE